VCVCARVCARVVCMVYLCLCMPIQYTHLWLHNSLVTVVCSLDSACVMWRHRVFEKRA